MEDAPIPWDEGDAALAASIFGVRERADVIALVRVWLSSRGLKSVRVLSLDLSVGAAIGVALPDGGRLFVKVWPPGAAPEVLAAQIEVQRALSARGYPAPRPRTGLEAFGGGWAVIMDYDRSGAFTDVRLPGVLEGMARALARLVRDGADLTTTPGLPVHAWPAALWPKPHNVLFDFDATTAGADWIDSAADEALATLRQNDAPPVLGHLDWSAKNMRMNDAVVAVVYDWDAVHLAPESFVVGAAAASFPTTWDLPVPPIPSRVQSAGFVAAYEQARGHAFTAGEREQIAASLAYSHAYTARCDHSVDPAGAKERWSSLLGRA